MEKRFDLIKTLFAGEHAYQRIRRNLSVLYLSGMMIFTACLAWQVNHILEAVLHTPTKGTLIELVGLSATLGIAVMALVLFLTSD